MHYKETQYGFEYGAAKVTRIHGEEKTGVVHLDVETAKEVIQLRVTKSGLIRTLGVQKIIRSPPDSSST